VIELDNMRQMEVRTLSSSRVVSTS
jgi:hypothetical protein